MSRRYPRGTMYLPCPTCGVVRTLSIRLNRYEIGQALHTNCHRCATRSPSPRTSLAAANAAALADEIAFISDTPEQTAKRLGTTPGAIARRFHRAGMHEQARPFQRIEQARRRAAA